MEPTRKTARLAGVLYLIVGLCSFYSLMYVSPRIMERGDAAVTARNILSQEFLYRTGIVSNLVSAVFFIFLVVTLYQLLYRTNAYQARTMVALVMVQVPIVFLLETCKLTALLTLKEGFWPAATPGQRQQLAFLFLQFHSYGILVVELFWGLWLIPFGQLVYRSVCMPRLLGGLLMLAGIGYAIDSLTFMLFPNYRLFTRLPAYGLSGLGELSIILWLLIKGVKTPKSKVDSPTSNPLADPVL